MKMLKIPAPISGGLILSYKCSASCRHCMYACSPKWKADWISDKQLEKCLNILAGKIKPGPWGKNSIGLSHGLHFTGGEPFLNFALLLKATEIAEDLKIPSTFVETNCSWCSNNSVTEEKLNILKNKGLKGIMISVNPFYAEYIPFEKTERCIRISLEVFENNVFIYQQEFYRLFKHLGIKVCIPLADYLQLTEYRGISHNVEMFLMGKATTSLKDFYPSYRANTFFQDPCQPPFIRDWHNHFDNYGNFMPGFCGGISLGHWQYMDEFIETGIDLDKYPVLAFLIEKNMEGLTLYAKDLGYQESLEGYLSKCDLCLDIRKFLAAKKKYDELQPKEFYNNLS